MPVQLELFTDVHEHVYTLHQGPYETQPAISLGEGLTRSRWCWTCSSWVNSQDVSQWEQWTFPKPEIAARYAQKVKNGSLHRSDAARLFQSVCGYDFFAALLEIDIAIGDLNSRLSS